jgi:CP family cyanate transporter-like MFS transporter
MAIPSERRAGAAGVTLRVFVAIVLVSLNLRTVIASLPPLLAQVRADLGLSAGVAGLLTTLPVLLFGLLAPAVPRLGRRVSLEWILVACTLVTAAGAALRGIGTTAALFAGSCLAGAAVAIAQAAVPMLIRIGFPRGLGRLTGGYSMALPLGAVLASGLAVPLQRLLGGSWQASLIFWVLPAVAAAALWVPAARRRDTRVEGPPPHPLWRNPLAWAVAAVFGLQSAAFYGGLAWLPEILHANGASTEAAGGLYAITGLASMGPALFVPVIAARHPSAHRALLLFWVAVATTGVVGLLASPHPAALWMVLIGSGQGAMLGLTLMLPAMRAIRAGTAASLTAMMFFVGYLLAAIGPWLMGLAHDATGGWRAALAVLIGLTLLQLAPGLAATRSVTVEAR